MGSLATRAITSFFIVVIIFTMVWGGVYSFVFLMLLIQSLALIEFYKLVGTPRWRPYSTEGIVLSGLMMTGAIAVIWFQFDYRLLLINILAVIGLFVREIYRKNPFPFLNLALTFFGVLYIALPLILFVIMSFMPLDQEIYHRDFVMGYFVLLWSSDTGAYVAGSLFGKHRLFERVSPKKTWEGSIGGAVVTMLIAYGVSSVMTIGDTVDWMIIGILVVVMGTYGDLFKSVLKRLANVKDSGNLLPGHGGFLDRFDSLIGSSPLVFCYVVCASSWKS